MSKTKIVKIAGLAIGGSNPVRVESMLKTSFDKSFSYIKKELKSLEKAGCELLRIAVPNKEVIPIISKIKKSTIIPLMADIHFSEEIALKALDANIDSIRINPGNMKPSEIKRIVKKAEFKKTPMRIGVNAASFKKPIGKGKKAAAKLVNILLKIVKEIEKEKFYDMIVSIKSSDVPTTIWANELLSKKLPYPVHIGITEAGLSSEAIIKSSVGLGTLLAQGIGDTLRISLTGKSSKEVEVGYEILKALNLRRKGVEIISCPTCGRCKINVKKIAEEVRKKTLKIKEPLIIAVMGCEVNGPGEAKEADIGIAGGKNCAILFKKGKIIRKVKLPHSKGYVNKEKAEPCTLCGAWVKEERIVNILIKEIKNLI
jgi:(E)-4-hydroxy-3-methylbut-2-enyl-diphosphate synthase